MFTVLSIDGGGIRGIIPAVWLAALEERLGSPLAEHFDLIAGTSTGSVLAAGLAAGIPAARLAELYEKHGSRIFPPRGFTKRMTQLVAEMFLGPRYSPEPLAEVLKEHFVRLGNEPILLSELRTNCLIVAYDVHFRLVRALKSWEGPGMHIPAWEACKASCSAPTYFPAHVIDIDGVPSPLVDGGVVANNPSSLALAEAIGLASAEDLSALDASNDLLLVSMGTGNLTRQITVKEATEWGSLQWAFPILDVVFDGTAFASDLVCRAILKTERYVRLQIDLKDENEDLDDARDENILELKGRANAYMTGSDGHNHFDRLEKLLLGRTTTSVSPPSESGDA